MTGRTLNGRKLRRKVLAGAVLVFITAGYSGKRFIFEKAHQLGVKSVVLDTPDRCAAGVCVSVCVLMVCMCACECAQGLYMPGRVYLCVEEG